MDNLPKEVEIQKTNKIFENSVSKKEWAEPQLYIISSEKTKYDNGVGVDGGMPGASS